MNPPIYWEALHGRQDYDLFIDTLATRDYGALVFLAPLESLHESATTGFYFTPPSAGSSAGGSSSLEGDGLAAFLADEKAASVEAFIDAVARPEPTKPSALVAGLAR